MAKPKLFLLDANSFCYRAFFAVKADLTTSYGQPTGAVFGFLNIVKKILKENSPDYLCACFDVSRNTFRKDKFADYKKGRAAMPEALVSQMGIIKEILSAYNFYTFEKEGFEADDIIATVAKKASGNFSVFIVSSDKDMLQLVGDDVKVYNPYHDEPVFDKDAVSARFGVEPQNIADIVALTGDKIDNIPGVKGVGEKTASGLIKQYGTIENLLSHLEEVTPPRIKDMLKRDKDNLMLAKELAVLDARVPLDLDFAKLKITAPDYAKLRDIFKRLEFKSMLKGLPLDEPPVKTAVVEINEKSKARDFVSKLRDDRSMVFIAKLDSGDIVDGIYFYRDGETYSLAREFFGEVKEVFYDEKIKKIGYDFKNVKAAFKKYGLEIRGIDFDILLAVYILDPARPSYELTDIAAAYLQAGSAMHPAECAAKLKGALSSELAQKKQDKLFYEIEMPLSDALYDMEEAGIKLDLGILRGLSGQLNKRISSLIDEIYLLAGMSFNINSPKQLRLVLFDKLKLPVIKKTKTGPSTDEEVLRKLAKNNRLPNLLLEYRQLVKLKSTYIDALPKLADENSRLHSSFNQTATETGRLSSSSPNLQNIPVKTEDGRRIRAAFIPDNPDGFLLSADYSQVELRILAHLSGDENLISAFKNNRDVHRYTASLIFSVEEAAVSEEMRDTAKRVNFGIIYGMTSFGLSKDLDIPPDEAQRFIDEYFLRYPGVKKYIDKTIAEARGTGFVATLLGRRRYLPQLNSANAQLKAFAERQAINAPIQGSASDLIKLAMIKIHRAFKEKNLKSRMVLQVHDELIFDVEESELKLVAGFVKEHMEGVLRLCVPLAVDVKAGKSWYDMKALNLE